jgi:uncharacterized protein RhaS with RHS repeats
MGRWISRDPLGEFVGFDSFEFTGPNLYAAVLNNPINNIDPTGLIVPGDPDPSDEIAIAMAIKKVWPIIKKVAKDIKIDGPQRGGRICQIRYKSEPVLRIDYDAYPGTNNKRRLHGHLPKVWPKLHIPLDPRSFNDD